MDGSFVTALAALAGAALGGFTSFATSWTTARAQMRAEQYESSKARRQELYKQFIDEASNIYGDALRHDELDLTGFIGLYALTSRMRVLSSQTVIENAVKVIRIITEVYRQPNKTHAELEAMIHNNGGVDLLKDFSDACRTEFETHLSI